MVIYPLAEFSSILLTALACITSHLGISLKHRSNKQIKISADHQKITIYSIWILKTPGEKLSVTITVDFNERATPCHSIYSNSR